MTVAIVPPHLAGAARAVGAVLLLLALCTVIVLLARHFLRAPDGPVAQGDGPDPGGGTRPPRQAPRPPRGPGGAMLTTLPGGYVPRPPAADTDRFIVAGWPHTDTATVPYGHYVGARCQACELDLLEPEHLTEAQGDALADQFIAELRGLNDLTAADGWPVSDVLAPDDIYWPDQWARFVARTDAAEAERCRDLEEMGIDPYYYLAPAWRD